MPVASLVLLLGIVSLAVPVQQPAPPQVDLPAAIQALGSFDFAARTEAARTIRRLSPTAAVPALESAARTHSDEYVRFRALVLLSGLDTGVTTRVATDLMADRNDRLRTVAYQWFELHPRAEVLPRLIAALPRETSEFVRPALMRALAAYPNDAKARDALRPLIMRGDDLFRGSVIAALGEHRGAYALDDLIAVAKLDGPLQDDAVTAIGRLGNQASRAVIAELQASGSRELQPTVSAALCLLQTDCPARLAFIVETARFAAATDGHLPLLRGASHALAVLAQAGHDAAFNALIDTALQSSAAAREALTLSVGTVMLRRPLLALSTFETRKQEPALAELFRDAFDMLSEDFDEERFGTEVRRVLWTAPAGSPRRQAAQALLEALEF